MPSRSQNCVKPVVFLHQPGVAAVVSGTESLLAWEREARERCGLQGLSEVAATGTESCSAGCSDDCDQ